MIILACDKITKTFGVDIILDQITFNVNSGYRMGVVGDNGAGKSTLFNIIYGDLYQDEGEIYKSKNLSLAYLPQNTVLMSQKTIWEELMEVFIPLLKLEDNLRQMEKKMALHDSMEESEYTRLLREYSQLQENFEELGGYSYESYIRGILIGLGFKNEEFYTPIEHLSGGQKTRVALAKALLEKPDLLLLDEPTNHLDLDAAQWLEEHLVDYPGTIMVISHDRYFLDALCDHILEIENTSCRTYEGNYTNYVDQKKIRLAQEEKEYNNQQKEIHRQEEIIERFRSFNREKSIKAAESRQKRLDKIERIERSYESDRVRFSFGIERQSGQDVLSVDSLSKAFGEKRLFQGIDFRIRLGDRLALIGPNGCGKSTLFKIILGELPSSSGSLKLGAGVQIGYYDQELKSLNPEKRVIDELWDSFPQFTETQIRNALAARLFKGDDVYKPISALSGGEKGHLILTKLTLADNNLLLLDEPTNHLDMASREELEQALGDYPGTIFLISHDRYFLNKIANRIMVMESGKITEYQGNYDDYLNKKNMLASLSNQDIRKIEPTKTALKEERNQDRLKKEREKIKMEQLHSLEDDIHKSEKEIRELEQKMAKPDLYKNVEEMLGVQKKYSDLKEELDNLYSQWMDLSH